MQWENKWQEKSIVLVSSFNSLVKVFNVGQLINSESLDFPCYCAAQLAELTEDFSPKYVL